MPEPDASRVVDIIAGQRRSVTGRAIQDLDADPDQAARAVQLGQATGVPPILVHGDLEGFEREHRAGLVRDIINNNSELREWVARNPMASKVANDDWGQLDKLTHKIKWWGPDIAAPVYEAARGFAEGTGEALGTAEASLAKEYEEAPGYLRALLYPGRAKMDLFTAMLLGGARAIHHGAAETARQVGVDEQAALRFGKGMAELAEWKAQDLARQGVVVGQQEAWAYRLKLAEDRAKPWLDKGEIPPIGTDPLIDRAYWAEKAKHDILTLDEILDDAEKSVAIERSKETVDDLIRPLLKDKNSAVPFEAARRLYEDKLPAPGDGKLGDVPGFAEGYEAAARVGGGDIKIPLADWILKVPSEVRRELKKEFKPDAEGMNLEGVAEAEGLEIDTKPLIVESRRQAEKITAELPPVEEGFTRLWRGSRPGEELTATAYTSDLAGIALPFQKAYGGKLTYVDVPTADLAKYENKVGTATGVEFNVPPEVLQRAAVVPLEDIVRQGAGLDQVNALTPVLLEEGQSEAPLFGKMAIGLPKELYDRFIKAIDRQAEDVKAWELKKASEEIRRRRTKEWREDSKAMRPEVTFDVSNRPEWVAHNWFNDGVLRGTTGEKPKFDPEKLTPEQQRAIPKEYQAKGGMAPDDLARVAGFKTGDQMIDVMSRFRAEKGDLTPTEYLRKIVNYEVEKAMEAKHGPLKTAIIEEVQDHVTGIPQMERLHETTVALGLKANQAITFTKESMRAAATAEVGRRPIEKRDFYLKEAGKAGRDMIAAFLKQDWNGAFRLSQRQYMANLMANETGKLLDRKAKFETLASKFTKVNDPESFKGPLSGPYVPYIQQILYKVGRKVGRTPEQVADAITQAGYGTLEGFIQAKRGELRDIEIPDFMLGDKPLPFVDKMTGDQFKDLHDALIALDHHGRDEATVYREGKAEDYDQIRETMTEKLKTLGDVKINIHKEPRMIRKIWNTYYPGSLTIESILNRWDRDNAMGVFNQFIVRPLVEASNSEARLIRFYQKALDDVIKRDLPDLNKMVENSLWVDPYTKMPLTMSMRNVLGILMYWGNPSSRTKLLEGYGVSERAALEWLHQRTTKADWDRAQNIGHIFNRLIDLADRMSMRVNGVPVKKINIVPFETYHGQYKGWYNPVEYESLFPGRVPQAVADALKEVETMKLKGERVLEQPNYYRANTNQAYTKARTEYVAPTAMNLDIIPIRMRQMIHDITFREAVMQAGKFFYDPKWQSAVIHHYGKEYQELFVPYLKDVANYTNSTSAADSLIEHFRQNLISTMIGFNPHTVGKHGMTAAFNSLTEVGLKEFGEAVAGLLRKSDEAGTTTWKFAMNRSEELQKRLRNVAQYTHQPELSLRRMGLRETIQNLGATPVAISDLLSSVPTWVAQYNKSLRAGKAEHQAVFEADRAVRRAHGSPAVTNLPAIMRTNALGRTFTSLYGFFSHMMQKQFELAWKAKDSYAGIRAGDLSVAKEYAPQLIAGFVSYVIIPAVVEEMITPYKGHEKDSWGTWALKTMTGGLFASYVGPKDFVRSFLNTGEAAVGMVSSFSKEGLKLARDLAKGKGAFDKEHAGNLIRDTVTMVGLLSGYTNAQEGRVLQFFQRSMMGVDRPRTPWDWMHGFTTGKMEKKK